MVRRSPLPPGPAALVIAHPGHELRVHHWMERAAPVVCILTDGSGGTRVSRLERSREVIVRAGGVVGPIFGRFSDRDLYAALRSRDGGVFVGLAHDLAHVFDLHRIAYVAGDAIETYNTGHDLCRAVIDAAVALAAADGRHIANYEFPLIAAPAACPDAAREAALWVELDGDALDRKLAAAFEYDELRGEVEATLERHGRGAFAIEGLLPSRTLGHHAADAEPFYEVFGRARVEAGIYEDVITWRDHVKPVFDALARLGDPACTG